SPLAVGSARRLREAERNERAERAHHEPGQRSRAPRAPVERRRQQENARTDDPVDPDPEAIDKGELALRGGHSPSPKRTVPSSTTARAPSTNALFSGPWPNGAPARTGTPCVRSASTSSTVTPSGPGSHCVKPPRTIAHARAI